MKSLRLIMILILCSLSHYKTLGSELIVFQSDTFYLKNGILTNWPNYDLLKTIIFNSISNECRNKGFSQNVIWTIENNKLYLKAIKIVDWCSKNEITVPLEDFFKLDSNMHFASWCSSELEYGKGPILYNGFLINLYSSGGKMWIQNGILTNLISWENEKIVPPNSNIHSWDSLIYSNIDWEKFPKRQLKKKASITISFVIDDCGQVSNFKIIGSLTENNQNIFKTHKVRKRFKTEALRVAKLIPGMAYYKENGIPFKQPRMGFVIVFSEYNKAKFSKLSF
jgi:hypothetical protein